VNHVLHTLLVEHDLRLVLLAVIVCTFGAVSTMNISGRVSGRRHTRLWLALLSVCAGATVWATHFIAMLAYQSDIQTTYNPLLTALSLLSGIVVMGFGFDVALRATGPRRRALGGAVVGIGVVTLHYLGMAGVLMPSATLGYDPGLVATSVVLSLGFGALSLWSAFDPANPWGRSSGTGLMIAMIATLHFTAMGAVRLQQGDVLAGAGEGFSRSVLAMAVAAASFAVLLIGMASSILDQRVSKRLEVDAERFRALSEGAFEGVVVHRDGMVLDANAAARRMLVLDAHPERKIYDWFKECPAERWRPTTDGSAETVEVEITVPNGETFPAEMSRRRMELADGLEAELIAFRDLTARKESEARINHLALHDAVTELPNRRLFLELGHQATSVALRSNERLALMVLDIDGFKPINDVHGHDAGDAVLRAIAERISQTVRDSDVCARFGGDEFTILQTSVSQPAQTSALVERLIEVIREPVVWHGTEMMVGVSIGVAVYPEDGTTLERLIRNADTAMYRAKADGKGTSRFFEPHMDAALVARRRLEARLRKAVAENQFQIMYQPLVSASTRSPVAFEALLRWTDDELGPVSPVDFIPVAEETGLIVPIGEFVLRQACLDAMHWPSDLRVAVNLSVAQFRRRGLVENVKQALLVSGLPGHRLELEITEGLLIENREEAQRQLLSLRELGVHIAMDDFGTGFSSLSYLQSFPFDKLKIDRAFVSKLPRDLQSVAIVQAVVAMGRSLGMRLVAEGVETEVQAELLQRLECDDMQGFLIAQPMMPSSIPAFLHVSAGLRGVA
jgi:diguanylate cyclase